MPRHIAPIGMGFFEGETPRALHRLCHLRRHQHGSGFEPSAGGHLLEVALQQVTRARGVAVRVLPLLDPRLQGAVGADTEGFDALCARGRSARTAHGRRADGARKARGKRARPATPTMLLSTLVTPSSRAASSVRRSFGVGWPPFLGIGAVCEPRELSGRKPTFSFLE